METKFTKKQLFLRAEKRVKDIKGFYVHLTIYCIIIPIIIYANLTFEPHFHWFWFSVYGWGSGLLIHWLSVFGFKLLGIGKDWEEKKIKKYMEEQNRNH
ncbi:2TM domain-containing protein [Polaribacter sp. Z022]|uniref:2TM domain-containing protein n=1 Tax=Polaribacter sp. Z022 TaxID=2927125 RepID=UPI0020225AB0|nr:2TM domain-containing protein [Polaribacter sp. Z022]MCL7753391.1 2TM domain-containing protein [Polaribacter sp. Z022]